MFLMGFFTMLLVQIIYKVYSICLLLQVGEALSALQNDAYSNAGSPHMRVHK